MVLAPSAVALFDVPVEAFAPKATALTPLAVAFRPQPRDDPEAEAALFVAVTALTTGLVVVAAEVRKVLVSTGTALTNGAAVGVVVTPVSALPTVVLSVAPVKNGAVVWSVAVATFCVVTVPLATRTF
jgi:hypothetical protein